MHSERPQTNQESCRKIEKRKINHCFYTNDQKSVKKKLDFVWKRVRKSLEKKRPENYFERKEQLERLKELEKQGKLKIYYADGSGFSLTPCVPYAWQEKGKRIKVPSFKSKTLNLFGIWDAKSDLSMYSVEGSLTSEIVISYMDDFCMNLEDNNIPTVLVIDNASIHTSNAFKEKIPQWKEKGLEIFYLPTYSPHLNLIEHLWRFMKYEWVDFSIYNSWEKLLEYVDDVVKSFGKKYTINFG